MNQNADRPINILLVEDDPGDVVLTKRALSYGSVYQSLNVVNDGVEALRYLRKEGEYVLTPPADLILLDLNMPRMDGREVLIELKADPQLNVIPVIILTTSDANQDIAMSYGLQASCYVTKPADLQEFTRVVQAIKDFWLTTAKLPEPIG